MSDSGSMSRILAGLISAVATLAAALLTLWLRDRTQLSKRIQVFEAAAKELSFWETLLRMQEYLPEEERHNLRVRAAHHLGTIADELTAAVPRSENRFVSYRPKLWNRRAVWIRAVEAGKDIHKQGTYRWRKLKCAVWLRFTKAMYVFLTGGVLAGFVMFGYGIYRALAHWDSHELGTTGKGICVLLVCLLVGALVVPFEEDAERAWKERYEPPNDDLPPLP